MACLELHPERAGLEGEGTRAGGSQQEVQKESLLATDHLGELGTRASKPDSSDAEWIPSF